MSAPLSILTFETLVERIRRKRVDARVAAKKAGWLRLEGVAASLAGGDRDDGLLSGPPWSLLEARVEGYQGVRFMEPLRFDPSPGVTVLRGDNGSGKSSLAEAIETGLSGCARPRATGGGGSAPLWDRTHVSNEAGAAEIVLVLTRPRERLELTTRITPNGAVGERNAIHEVGGVRTEIDLEATSWGSALSGFRPVFAYAAVERRVQLAKDLKGFLEPMLALGGCIEDLEAALAERSADPLAVENRWQGQVRETQEAVARVDSRYDDGSPMPPLRWPSVEEDPEAWLIEHALTEPGAHVPPVTSEHGQRVRDGVEAVAAALVELEAAEATVLARVAGPLRALSREAADLDDDGGRCPVCTQPADDWRSTLASSLDGLEELGVREATFDGCLSVLRSRLGTELREIARVVDQPWFDADVVVLAEPVREHARRLWEAFDRDGIRSSPDVRATVRSLEAVVDSDDWTRVVAVAVDRGDHRVQWARARREAVEPMLATWRADGPTVATAAEWHEAANCLRALRKELQKERTTELEGRADESIRRLLADVGLRIEGVTVQKTKADMRVVDAGGLPVELSMLSAGQRNALLLAPLLAVSEHGPFAFLILDDPVHAFDDLRVDRLAHAVAEIATTRRVVVFTHDDRLREHLAAVAPSCAVHSVARDHATGAVTHDRSAPAWRVLLDDAFRAFDLPRDRRHDGAEIPTDLVRGFCRMAVDAALRHHVMLVASTEPARDVHADLGQLDGEKVHTTGERFEVVRRMCPDAAVEEAWQVFEPHRLALNRAVHGNEPAAPVERQEIRDVERLCALLGGISP